MKIPPFDKDYLIKSLDSGSTAKWPNSQIENCTNATFIYESSEIYLRN